MVYESFYINNNLTIHEDPDLSFWDCYIWIWCTLIYFVMKIWVPHGAIILSLTFYLKKMLGGKFLHLSRVTNFLWLMFQELSFIPNLNTAFNFIYNTKCSPVKCYSLKSSKSKMNKEVRVLSLLLLFKSRHRPTGEHPEMHNNPMLQLI